MILLAEQRLRLPPLFYLKLVDIEDDWAFILKLHALFEGAVYRVLVDKASQVAPAELPVSERDSFYTKVETAARLILPDEQIDGYVPAREYLLALNRVRNRVTHDLRFINLNLHDYIASLSEVEFQKAARSLAISFPDEPVDEVCRGILKDKPPRHRITTVREFMFNFAGKVAIWEAGGRVLTLLSVCLHLQPDGNSWARDPRMDAALQDLLHDPAVLEWVRKASKESGLDLT